MEFFRNLRNEQGQMLVLTALTMAVLIGFLALATDVGTLFHARRQLQIAADAAATTGATDQLYGRTLTQTVTDARNAAAANGATNGSNGTVVTISTPPLNGYHRSPGYVEAIIHQPNPTFFMNLFGFHSMTIAARAVAGSPAYSKSCIYLMDPTDYDLKVQGSNTIDAPGCAIYVNSDNPQSIISIGGAVTVDAPYVATVGGGPTSVGGAPVYAGAAPESAPNIQSVGAVPPGDCTQTISTLPSATTIEGADGVVCFTGSNVDVSGYTLNNGVFVFENGVTVGNPNGNTNVNNGTIEVYGGTFTQNSNSLLNITAPASLTETFGTTNPLSYDGVALLVPVTNTSYNEGPCASAQPGNGAARGTLQVQFGSNDETLDGFIVAPNADVYLQDNGGGVTASGIYAGCMFGKSSTLTIPSYNAAHPYTTPLRSVALVE